MSDTDSLVSGAPDLLHQLVDSHELTMRGIDLAAPAITDGTDRLDHRAYADHVARLAGALGRLGVEPGDRVAVHLRKSVRSFVAVHAVLRAGAVMVPLDPLAPLDHVGRLLDDAAPTALVTDVPPGRLAQLVAGTSVAGVVSARAVGDDARPHGVEVVEWADALAGDPAPPAPVGPDDPAYVIYTSGSTGAPKGIVHTHRSALAYARLAAAAYELAPADVLANVASLHFDQSTFELYAAPLVGACVVVVPDALLRFPASTSELIERERVTVWYSVPYILRQLVDRGALDQRDLTSLRWILFGGEVYPPGELAALMTAIPSARVSNVYGPAEVNQCTYFHLDEPPSVDEPVPIGRAWPETDLLLVGQDGPDGEPVPSGAPGELLVATTTLMAGYWNRPDLTAASIVERDGRRWYRTGDLVRTRRDGDLEFLGRADNQVKIRGQRVELEAVDAVLLDTPGVREGGVVVDRTAGGDELVAGVVTEAGVDVTSIARSMAARLPGAAVPTTIVALDSIPRSPNGKIDRSALVTELTVGGAVGERPGAGSDTADTTTTTPTTATTTTTPTTTTTSNSAISSTETRAP